MWVVWLENRQECDICVNHNAKRDPYNHGIENGMTDVPQENKEASEEEEDGKV
jgi:hypothetical protein